MGKIRTADIKNSAKELWEEFPGMFGADFEKNKKAIKENGLVEEKRLRNRMAGYLVRLARQKN